MNQKILVIASAVVTFEYSTQITFPLIPPLFSALCLNYNLYSTLLNFSLISTQLIVFLQSKPLSICALSI